MIQHVWSVLCTKSVVDKETNNISLIEVLEQVSVVGPPVPERERGVIPINCELVTLWSRSRDNQPARGRARVTLRGPSGEVVVNQESEVDLSVYPRTRVRWMWTVIPFREPGCQTIGVELRVEGEAEWRDVSKVPLHIMLEPPESSQGMSSSPI